MTLVFREDDILSLDEVRENIAQTSPRVLTREEQARARRALASNLLGAKRPDVLRFAAWLGVEPPDMGDPYGHERLARKAYQ